MHPTAFDARDRSLFDTLWRRASAAGDAQTVGRSFTCYLPDSSIVWTLKITVRIESGPVLYSYRRSAWYSRYCISSGSWVAPLTRGDIYHLVAERVQRHGSRNAQDFAHLKHRLSTAEPDELFWGLLQSFLTQNADDTYDVQAVSGRLLLCLNPPCPIGLEVVIQHIAPGYNFSVEELPWYVAKQFGSEQSLATLERIPIGSETTISAQVIATFKYWISGDWHQRAEAFCR